jgi:16S rRNA (cytidine1402-2'-O)-methyltransferase
LNASKTAPLHLIPAGLGDAPWEVWLPPVTRDAALGLTHWVVENAKTARAQLKALGHPGPISDLDRKSTRLNSSHNPASRMPSSA